MNDTIGTETLTAPENVHLPYDTPIQVHHNVLAELVRKHTPQGRVLDVGCGLGYGLRQMRGSCPDLDLAGADMDEVCLERTRELVPDVQLIQMREDCFDAESLGEGYDTVTLAHVLEHLPHPLDVVQRLLEIVRPGGHLILGVPNPITPANVVGSVLRLWRVNPGHLHTWDRGHLMTFLENWVDAEVVEYAGDEVRIFPGRLKRLGWVRAMQIALATLLPWWTFTTFAVLRRPEGSD